MGDPRDSHTELSPPDLLTEFFSQDNRGELIGFAQRVIINSDVSLIGMKGGIGNA